MLIFVERYYRNFLNPPKGNWVSVFAVDGQAVTVKNREKSMFLECCNKLRSAKAYELEPQAGYVFSAVFFLNECPACKNAILLIKRYNPDMTTDTVRKRNDKAFKLFEKIKPYITQEYKPQQNQPASGFYLYCNEFGSIKKSYSNLSSLKMGLFDPPGADLPPKREILLLS